MSPSRRTPKPGPGRRPRVAGLRKPVDTPRPSPRPGAEQEAPESESPSPETAESTSSADPVENIDVPSGSESTDAQVTAPAEVDALTGESDAARPRPKPSPRRKTRDAGVPKPSSETEVGAAQAEPAETEPATTDDTDAEVGGAARATGSGASRTPLVAGLLVVAVLFAALAVFFRIQGAEARSATSNTALVDVARTAQVKEETSAAVEQLFSYDYNDIEKTENAAKELLATDEVREQYERQFAEVKRVAPEQKMVVTTKVTRSGVMMLDNNRAKVLVFVDQTSTRTDQNQTSAGGSQLSVEAEFRDDSWKITGLNTYNDLPQPPPAEDSGKAPEGK